MSDFEVDAVLLSYGSGESESLQLIGGPLNPPVNGVSALLDAKYFGTDGRIWHKKGPGDTEWLQVGFIMQPKTVIKGRLGISGFNSGNTNHGTVDGSATPVSFSMSADPTLDTYITQITIFIGDGTVSHNRFGGIGGGGLSVGWDLLLTQNSVITPLIDKAKTGGEVIAQSGIGRAFGDGGTSFELINFSGGEDAQLVSINAGEFCPGGFLLKNGSTDRLESVVNDNHNPLTDMYILVHGYQQGP